MIDILILPLPAGMVDSGVSATLKYCYNQDVMEFHYLIFASGV